MRSLSARVVFALLLGALLIPSPAVAAPPLQRVRTAVQHTLLRLQQRQVLRKVTAGRFTSDTLKQQAGATRLAMGQLGRAADRVELGKDPAGNRSASYFRGQRLLGRTTLERSATGQWQVALTSYLATGTQTREVFTTGRGAVALVAQELSLGLRGQKPWSVVLNQIKGELRNGTRTAGARVVDVSDIGRTDRTRSEFRVEQWIARGAGEPRSSAERSAQDVIARGAGLAKGMEPLPGASPRRGKVVLGSRQLRETRFKLDGAGNRIPHPDPEAGGRPMRETLMSQTQRYFVDGAGRAVFQATAQ